MNSSGKFKDVLGYLTETERIALQKCVLETSFVDGDALEIGSLNGLSALIILSVLRDKKTLVCVEVGQVETLKQNLLKHFPIQNQAFVLNKDFNQMDTDEEKCKLSFVFIDHDHAYENTIAAFNKFWPFISSGGIVAFHDYGHPDFKGGTNAINDIMDCFSLTKHLQADSLIAFKKP